MVYLTGHTHPSVDKALHVAGVGGAVKRKIPVDANNRMKTAALAEAITLISLDFYTLALRVEQDSPLWMKLNANIVFKKRILDP